MHTGPDSVMTQIKQVSWFIYIYIYIYCSVVVPAPLPIDGCCVLLA